MREGNGEKDKRRGRKKGEGLLREEWGGEDWEGGKEEEETKLIPRM